MGIKEKLSTIQTSLSAPKSQYNTFGKYNYRNCEDILNALKKHLKKLGCSIKLNDEIVIVGQRYYVKATATLIDNESDEFIYTTAYARESEDKKGMDSSQVTGATSSYARKYALNGLFAIDDTKDADNFDNSPKQNNTQKATQTNNVQQKTTPPKQNKSVQQATTIPILTICKSQIEEIRYELKRTGVDESTILKTFGLKNMEDMKTDTFAIVMKKFKATKTKEVKAEVKDE